MGVLRVGPKEDTLDFSVEGGGKQAVAAKRGQQPEQKSAHNHERNGGQPQKQADNNIKPSQEAAKVKDKLQAGQELNRNSTAKGTDASKQTNAAGAQQAKYAKTQLAQLKQNIKQEQQPRQDTTPSPERVAAGATLSNPAFATGGAMLGVDMGMIAAGGAMIDAWKFMNSISQESSSGFETTNKPAPRSSLADMPGIDTPDENSDENPAAELQALEAQEAELAAIEQYYAENTGHHEWREENGVDQHDIEAPVGTNVQALNEWEDKPDQFDIDYVGMNLRDVQIRYNYDSQPQIAVNELYKATYAHGGGVINVRKPANAEHDLPAPELARLGQFADQVMHFG